MKILTNYFYKDYNSISTAHINKIEKEVPSVNFDYFWYAKHTIDNYTNGEYVGFRMFDITHISSLVLLVALCVGLGIIYNRMNENTRRKTLIILGILCIADELFKHIANIVTGQYVWEFLPLHLCSINIFVILAYIIKPGKLKAELLYSLCIPGAALALISPSWTKLPVLNFMHLHSYTIHVMLVLFPILLLAGGFRPDFRRLPKCLLCIAIACIVIYPVNKLLDTNFMFLNGTDNNPILELLAGFLGDPGYIAAMPVLLVIVWALMYTPWIIADRIKARKGIAAE